MCGEEHAEARTPRHTWKMLDDLVVVGSILEALGYSAGSTASFTMSIQRAAEAAR